MPYAQVNDIRMYYEERGQGEPLVLLHGATGGIGFRRSAWNALASTFADHYRALHSNTEAMAGRTTWPGSWPMIRSPPMSPPSSSRLTWRRPTSPASATAASSP